MSCDCVVNCLSEVFVRKPALTPMFEPSAWYVLSGSSRGDDLSGNGHVLTASVAVSDVAGVRSGMLASFGGRLIGDGTAFRASGSISTIALADLAGTAGDRWFAACEKVGANGRTHWKFGVNSARGLFYAHDHGASGHQDIAVKAGIFPAAGYHVAGLVRHDDGVTLDFYIDGALVATETATSSSNGGSSADLIVMNDAYNNASHMLQAVGLFGRALTPDEMMVLSRRLLGK